MKKSDMITIDNINIEFSSIGLFDTKEDWCHPNATVSTYEVIYVTEGLVNIAEGEEQYTLSKGDMLLLDAGITHRGTAVSHGRTGFYWLHFNISDMGALHLPKLSHPEPSVMLNAMRELMHLSVASRRLCEIALAKLLFECAEERTVGNSRAYEIDEYIRVHSEAPLTVTQVAEHFSISPDHMSRLLKRQFGYDAKTAIVKRRLHLIKSCLINTDKVLKEIAEECGFEDENALVKFFKYHEKITPTAFRNKFFYIHTNSK